MSKDPLPPLSPWYVRAALDIWTYLSWPLQVREMKRLGFRKTGFMTWELGPEDKHG
jgi:hypothetical protein